MEEIHSQTMKRATQLVDLEKENQRLNFEVTMAVRDSLIDIRDQSIAHVNQKLGSLHSSIVRLRCDNCRYALTRF